jgi:hypothetical protein
LLKLPRLTAGGNVVLDGPLSPERHREEEPERRDRHDGGTGGEAPFLGQMQEISPDLRRPQKIRRSVEVIRETNDVRKVNALRVGGEIADPHVLDHAASSGVMDSSSAMRAAPQWRDRIVSRRSARAISR